MVSHSRCFVLNKAPVKEVDFSEGENATFKLVTKPLRPIENGEILIKTLFLSNDPTQRAWIQKGLKADRMYVDPVREGNVMRSSGLGKVVESKLAKYPEGTIVSCSLKWSDYAIVKEQDVFYPIVDTSVPLTLYLDLLGITGLTAYFGLTDVANLKASDVILVSAASGATGSTVVQIAKNVIGCKRVIGISGGPEKCKYVESIGADACVDYRDKDFARNLYKAAGGKVDVFFDGVGGKILDLGMTLVKPHGQVLACGAITGYNDFSQGRVNNWGQIITQRLHVKGFLVLDYQDRYQEAMKYLVKWLKEGKIKSDEKTFTLVDLSRSSDDFKKIPESWGLLFSDKKGPGKLLTKL